MTKEQIAKFAKQSGFTDADENSVWIADGFWTLELQRFAALVRAAEREAILQMSRDQWFKTQADFEDAIRARGQA